MRDYYAVLGVSAASHDGRRSVGPTSGSRASTPPTSTSGSATRRPLRGDRRGLPHPERSDWRARSTTGRRVRRARPVAVPVRRRPRGPGAGATTPHVAGRARRSRRRSPASRRICRSTGCRRARPVAPPARPRAPRRRTCSHCGGLGTVWSESGAPSAGYVRPAREPARAWRRPASGLPRSWRHAGPRGGARAAAAGNGHRQPDPRSPARATAGPFGGPRGDLIVIARVHDDPRFTRKGDNLYCEVPLSVVEAVLGARVTVKRCRRLRGPRDPARHAERPGVPAAGQGRAAARRGRARRPLRDGAGRDSRAASIRRTQELFRELGRLLPAQPDVTAPGSARE